MANPPPKPLTEVVEAAANRHQEAGYLPSTGDNLSSSSENASGEFEKSFQKFHLRSRRYPADGECRSAAGESFHSKTDDCGWQGRQSDQTAPIYFPEYNRLTVVRRRINDSRYCRRSGCFSADVCRSRRDYYDCCGHGYYCCRCRLHFCLFSGSCTFPDRSQ